MNIHKINPYIRHVMHSELPPQTHINRRIILDYELLYIESGKLMLTYNEKDFLCKAGDILLLCPNIPHTFHVIETLSQPHIHFDVKYDAQSEQVFVSFQDYNELTAEEHHLIRNNIFPNLTSSPFLNIVDKEEFLKTFFEVVDHKNLASLGCKAKMLCLLETIMSDNTSTTTIPLPTVTNIAPLVKSYIDANYDQNISLYLLERQFDYSKYYIERLFKKEYGISVMTYRNKKRMESAVSLLEEHSVSVTAELLGFPSIYAFSRAFQTYYGASPSKYKPEEKESQK